jgi:hypothetical protein
VPGLSGQADEGLAMLEQLIREEATVRSSSDTQIASK